MLLVLLATAGWAASRTVDLRGDLQAVADLTRRLQQQAMSGDREGAAATLAAVQRRTGAAAAAANDPAVRLASLLPGRGRDIRAARVLATAADDLARDVLPPLLDAARQLDPPAQPATSGVDLRQIRALEQPVTTALAALDPIRKRLATIPVRALDPAAGAAVTDLRRKLDRGGDALRAAQQAVQLLPAMLGGGGERRYLVLFQNLAEVRATGGMPGAWAVVAARDGHLTMTAQGTASVGLRAFDAPVLPVDPQVRSLYGAGVASHPANITMVPNFPTAAAVAREMYRRRSGETVDGVVATDPVALSYLLAATGPVAVAGGPALATDNAVRVLLAETYARYPTQAQQDAYFADAARATFQALTGRALNRGALLTQLSRIVAERRLLVWSASPDEQRGLAGTPLEGALPDRDAAAAPLVGVFLNDGGGSKLDYYLVPSLELVSAGCSSDGLRELTLRVTLRSAAPASGLPAGVLTFAEVTDPYTARTFVSVYAPVDWGVERGTLDGAPVRLASGSDGGRMVVVTSVDLPPGASRVLEVRLVAQQVQPGGWKPQARTTPTVRPWTVESRSAESCG
ncbi:hypothetical protein GCM10009827_112180 [Dactylosporangium maewongense]|uniref:DUF4012 domain-containing protein n=1 Tax=Dactylosporangium maewongense TaxID=634393 RepID=A0ABN2D762_9ACTN